MRAILGVMAGVVVAGTAWAHTPSPLEQCIVDCAEVCAAVNVPYLEDALECTTACGIERCTQLTPRREHE